MVESAKQLEAYLQELKEDELQNEVNELTATMLEDGEWLGELFPEDTEKCKQAVARLEALPEDEKAGRKRRRPSGQQRKSASGFTSSPVAGYGRGGVPVRSDG